MKTPMNKMSRKIRIMKNVITMSMIALVLSSCGKSSENEIRSDDLVNTNPIGNPIGNPTVGPGVGVGADLNGYWTNLKAQHACSQNGGRMQDIGFTLQGSASGGQVYGSMTQGTVGGQITQTYTGLNYGTKDLMFVSQVINNGQVAYNVVLSFCRYIDQYGQEFIGENAGLTQFQAQMTIENSTNCPTGQIENGWIQFRSNLVSYDARRFTTVNTSCY